MCAEPPSDAEGDAGVVLGVGGVVGQGISDLVDFNDAHSEAMSEQHVGSAAGFNCKRTCLGVETGWGWISAIEGVHATIQCLAELLQPCALLRSFAMRGKGVARAGQVLHLHDVDAGCNLRGATAIEGCGDANPVAQA
jgi:hypothetical protein